MKELKVAHLTKTYGEKTLFDQISFLIHEKDRIGLIGINGTGKSSLLKILAGKDSGDGDVTAVSYPNGYRIGFLSQSTDFSDEETILETVFQGESPVIQTVRRYEQALLALTENENDPQTQAGFTRAEEQMNENDAWMTDTNAKIILQKLGLKELHKKIGDLSGGQKKRVGLAQVLIDEPDLLLLDEPTNHLDYEAILWLENYLNQYQGALMMVTHDRYFLDRVANRMFELSFGKLYEYKGNYEAYLLEKAERERIASDQEDKRKQLYKQELAWMRKGAKARSTKQQARIGRFEELKENLYQVQTTDEVAIDVATKRLGKKVLEIKSGNYSIENQLILKDFDLLIQSKERLGITGENGTGKSTLLNLLAGRLELDSGTLSTGETVRLAYYTQQNEAMDENQRMIAYLQEAAEQVRQTDGTQISVAEILERFLFPRQMHGTLIGKLSGGEKRRLYLLKLLIGQPNVLLMDEPTNDLDISTLTVLEDYLDKFPGAVITVSHDRYFLDKVAEKLLIFKGQGQIEGYYGSIMDYLQTTSPSVEEPKISQEKTIAPKKKKMSYLEQKEWETIEEEITKLEEKCEELTEEMNHQGDNFTKLQELQQALSDTETELEEKMARWEYLSDFADA
ncbi:ABC-F family ATP-binding cassette domain-containing protein [Enterococcus sp. JM9B]|uniref:ABC-F family ATP-binding cassette domain-containing protein n=1 Tax=Enterococcus sp. JM9B TaxID=1857216 RepID=UPI0013749F4C|nr:ABC-F family ATP-binding cassette domain-containing protein [Enterococcus sp. JM9B]KAF1304799.1 multidrug ABC transporter ATP-binding protein [Enterococcus sp. JM9B]